MRTALITGVTGQDGSYLAELLLDKGYEVHGLIRRASSFNTHRLDGIYQDPHESGVRFFMHYGDLTDSGSLINLIRDLKPDEIYNLGAQGHARRGSHSSRPPRQGLSRKPRREQGLGLCPRVCRGHVDDAPARRAGRL